MPDERKEFEELTIKFGKGLAEDSAKPTSGS